MLYASDIASALSSHGVCYIPGFLSTRDIVNFRIAADYIINTYPYFYQSSYDDSVSIGQVQTSSLLKSVYRLRHVLKSLYSPRLLSAISLLYNKPLYHIAFHRQIISQKTFPTSCPPSCDLHWDRLRSIKCWFYLKDCNLESGPIKILPGTHVMNRSTRLNALSSLECSTQRDYSDINNRDAASLPTYSLPESYSAGDLIIFDTDCSHGAQPISPNNSRFILRSYSSLKSDLKVRNALLS